MRKPHWIYFIIWLILSTSTTARANPGQTVAVVPPSYTLFRTGTESPEDATGVTQMVNHAIKDAGLNAVESTLLNTAMLQIERGQSDPCRDQECLLRLTAELGAANAVAVSVIDKEAHYLLDIVFATGEPIHAKVFGNRTALLDDIYGNITNRLRMATTATKEDPSTATVTITTSEQPVTIPAPKSDAEVAAANKGIRPLAFYLSAAATVAFGLGFGAIEIIGLSKEFSFKNKGTPGDVDRLNTLRVVDAILLGATGVAAITTAILYFPTNFSKKADRKVTWLTSLSPTIGGGALLVQGRF